MITLLYALSGLMVVGSIGCIVATILLIRSLKRKEARDLNERLVNDYANAAIKRDQLTRNDGKPEHDRTTDGMRLKERK